MKGYKVVCVEDGKLLSWLCSIDSYREFMIEYKLNEFVKARTGKLFFFKELKYAQNLVYGSRDSAIYKCETINGRKAKHSCDRFDPIYLRKFWRDKLISKKKPSHRGAPMNGTYFADAIKLLERVK